MFLSLQYSFTQPTMDTLLWLFVGIGGCGEERKVGGERKARKDADIHLYFSRVPLLASKGFPCDDIEVIMTKVCCCLVPWRTDGINKIVDAICQALF